MSDPVREAIAGVRRREYDEALVQLWNAIELARIAGDGAALGTIASLTQRIESDGDEGQRREAKRLREAVLRISGEDAAVPATGRVDAELSPEGEAMADELDGAAQTTRRPRAASLLWLLLVVAVILVNVLERLGD